MVTIYVRLIIQGKKTLEQVPDDLKDQVKELLKEYGYSVD